MKTFYCNETIGLLCKKPSRTCLNRASLFLSCALLILASGCEARIEVAKDKVLSKIDNILGELEVKQKEIELGMQGFSKGIESIRRAKILTKVKAEQIGRRVNETETTIARIDKSLRILRPHLDATDSVDIAGKTYTIQQIKNTADEIIERRKRLSKNLNEFREVQNTLSSMSETLANRQKRYQGRLETLETRLSEIDIKRVATRAMKEASVSVGSGDQSFLNAVEQLEAKVDDLFAEVEVELALENDRWDGTAQIERIEGIDSLIKDLEQPSDTAMEIDAILDDPKEDR